MRWRWPLPGFTREEHSDTTLLPFCGVIDWPGDSHGNRSDAIPSFLWCQRCMSSPASLSLASHGHKEDVLGRSSPLLASNLAGLSARRPLALPWPRSELHGCSRTVPSTASASSGVSHPTSASASAIGLGRPASVIPLRPRPLASAMHPVSASVFLLQGDDRRHALAGLSTALFPGAGGKIPTPPTFVPTPLPHALGHDGLRP